MKKTILILLAGLFGTTLSAQQTDTLLLYPGSLPDPFEIPTGSYAARSGVDYSVPRLTVFHPEKPNGVCIIMCPGGGYVMESLEYEGTMLAPWLNAMGVTYCVLQYRLPFGRSEVPLQDAEQAMRLVRNHAAEWNVKNVGIMGCSAGGHLASTLATHYSTQETRPDFQVLLYPVISMDMSVTHAGSNAALIGDNPSEDTVRKFSNERHVDGNTPPAFIVLSADDSLVLPENSLLYFRALSDNNVKVCLHIYPSGGHGWCSRPAFKYQHQWEEELARWIDIEILRKRK